MQLADSTILQIIFCYEGAVRVLVHRTEFSIAEGGIFLVPRGGYRLSLNPRLV